MSVPAKWLPLSTTKQGSPEYINGVINPWGEGGTRQSEKCGWRSSWNCLVAGVRRVGWTVEEVEKALQINQIDRLGETDKCGTKCTIKCGWQSVLLDTAIANVMPGVNI